MHGKLNNKGNSKYLSVFEMHFKNIATIAKRLSNIVTTKKLISKKFTISLGTPNTISKPPIDIAGIAHITHIKYA